MACWLRARRRCRRRLGMALHRSWPDPDAAAFLAFAYVDLVLLFVCLRRYERAEPGSKLRELQRSNCDIRAYIAAIEIMQNYYPERLGKALMIHVPYMFMKAWKMIYPFIDNNTREKFVRRPAAALRACLGAAAQRELEAELRKMAPANGRTVPTFPRERVVARRGGRSVELQAAVGAHRRDPGHRLVK